VINVRIYENDPSWKIYYLLDILMKVTHFPCKTGWALHGINW